MEDLINPSKKFYYGVRDFDGWGDTHTFQIDTVPKGNCLENNVCFPDWMFIIVEKDDTNFTFFDYYNDQYGEIMNEKEVISYYSNTVVQEADLLVVFRDWNSPLGVRTKPINRTVTGIGDYPGDNSHYYGSRGTLKQFVRMLNISRYAENPTENEYLLYTLAHEIAHHWLMYLTDSRARLSDRIHYTSCVIYNEGKYGEIMSGYWLWKMISEDEFIAPNPDTLTSYDYKFDPVSLYLMGLIPKEEVPPINVIIPSEFEYCNQDFQQDGYYHVKGSLDTITIQDITNIYGERRPDNLRSRKEFTVQFAIVVHEDSSITSEDVDVLVSVLEEFPDYFSYVTSGRGSIEIISPQ